MISHRNVIANTLQAKVFEKSYRDVALRSSGKYPYTEIALGLLPQIRVKIILGFYPKI